MRQIKRNETYNNAIAEEQHTEELGTSFKNEDFEGNNKAVLLCLALNTVFDISRPAVFTRRLLGY